MLFEKLMPLFDEGTCSKSFCPSFLEHELMISEIPISGSKQVLL